MSGFKRSLPQTKSLNQDFFETDKHNLILECLIKGHSLRSSENLASALSFYEKALIYDKDNLEALIACGECLFALRKFDNAVETFKKALFIEPENRYLWRCCCQSLALTCNINDAIKFCESLLSKWADCGQTHFIIAQLYHRIKDFENAKNHYQEAVFLGFDIKETCLNLGTMLLEQEQPKEAIEFLTRAVRENVFNPTPYFYLGRAFLALADNKTALFNFKKYLDLTNDDLLGANNYIKICEADTKNLPAVYIKELFNQYADDFDHNLVEKLNYIVPQEIASEVEKIVLNQKQTILDLGCGTGLVGEKIKPFSSDLWGIDIASNMIEQAQNKNIYDTLIVNDITNLTLDTKFDIIIAGDVLVYFGELENIFKMVKNLLKPRGFFIASVESDNEKALHDGFIFKDSRRFGHNKNYLTTLAKNLNFDLKTLSKITPRYEKGEPLNGYLFTLQKKD